MPTLRRGRQRLGRVLLACCPPGGTVVDPFVGVGTTVVVSEQLAEEGTLPCIGIGIDLNAKYVKIARENVLAAREKRAAAREKAGKDAVAGLLVGELTNRKPVSLYMNGQPISNSMPTPVVVEPRRNRLPKAGNSPTLGI